MRPSAPRSPFIHLDPRSRESLQTQIYRAIRNAILRGALAPGARVISSRALANDLTVSRTTSLLAFDQLRAEGYIVARHGSGTFVAAHLPDEGHTVGRTGAGATEPPPIARRGVALAAQTPSAWRLGSGPRAFRLGVPPLDLFPTALWTRLVTHRVRHAGLAHLDYGDPAGHRSLRTAIAGYVADARGTTCSPDHIFVVGGAQRGLELACHALLDHGDEAVMEEPGFPGARAALLAAGARIRPIAIDAEGLAVSALTARAPHARLAYVTPSHQFPLGVAMSLPRRLALLQWARTARAWIVEDDYDSEYRYGARPIPCLHGLDPDGRVVYVGSFSKTLFPALRMGFLIVPPTLHDVLTRIRRVSDIHPPVLEQLALADFIDGGHYGRHLRRVRTACRLRLEALDAAARRYCGTSLTLRPVTTGLHVVADVAADVDMDALLAGAAAEQLEVMPLSAYFSAPRRTSPRALVLGFGAVDPETITAGMQRLARAIEASSLRAARRSRSSSRRPVRLTR